MSSAEPNPRTRARLAVLAASVLGLALFVPAVFSDVATLEEGSISGVMALLVGWMALLEGQVGWVANLLLIAVWILSLVASKRLAIGALVLSVLTLGVGYSSFLTLPMQSWDASELHMRGEIQSFGLGIYLWSAALLAAPSAAALAYWLSPPTPE